MFEDRRFYFGTIRKIVASFGTIFTGIQIARFSGFGGTGEVLKVINVPTSYGPSQKYITVNEERQATGNDATNAPPRTGRFLPRISFELVSMQYDSGRQVVKMNKMTHDKPGDVNAFRRQYRKVPYDFGFNVYIAVKNIDDGLQIIEQILPNFNPSFNIMVKDIEEMGLVSDIPVLFTGVQFDDSWEGVPVEKRTITFTLSFVVKGYLYPFISDASVIRRVIANIHEREGESKIETITTEVVPFDADKDDDWNAVTTITVDSNG
jgi:hypothetical protein